ncbi:MAG: hypothetical protein ACLFVG_02810 [Candidatus Aminicenantes bacterium]
MSPKKAAAKKTKPKAKKTTRKSTTKKRTKAKKGEAYQCSICGYRIIVDEVCGCAEEHVFVCCDKPMKKKRGRKAA